MNLNTQTSIISVMTKSTNMLQALTSKELANKPFHIKYTNKVRKSRDREKKTKK